MSEPKDWATTLATSPDPPRPATQPTSELVAISQQKRDEGEEVAERKRARTTSTDNTTVTTAIAIAARFAPHRRRTAAFLRSEVIPCLEENPAAHQKKDPRPRGHQTMQKSRKLRLKLTTDTPAAAKLQSKRNKAKSVSETGKTPKAAEPQVQDVTVNPPPVPPPAPATLEEDLSTMGLMHILGSDFCNVTGRQKISRARRGLSLRCHPDKTPDEAALRRLQTINNAHDRLTAFVDSTMEFEQAQQEWVREHKTARLRTLKAVRTLSAKNKKRNKTTQQPKDECK